MERRINRIIRDPSGRVIRSPETGGYALPEAYEMARNAVFLLKPLYSGEEASTLFGRFDDETRYVQSIFRQAANHHPAGVQVDHYRVPFSADRKQQALRSLVEGKEGTDRLVIELEMACDDEAPYTARWEVRDRILGEQPGNPALVERLLRLVNSDAVALQLLAVEILGLVGDPSAIPSLLRTLYEDSHSDVRGFAGLALGQLGVREARLPIAHRALQAPDLGEKHDLLCALALLGGLEDEAPGIHLAPEDPADPAADLRSTLMLSVTEGMPGLAATLLDPESPRGQRLASLSLLELSPPQDALVTLFPLFTDPDEPVAAAALQVAALLIRRGENSSISQAGVGVFGQVLDKSMSARCRETAATVLGRIGDRSMINLLDRRGLGDPDILVRDAAERSLKQVEDRVYGYHRVRNEGDIGIWPWGGRR